MLGRKKKSPESFDSSFLPLSQCLAKSRKTAENVVSPGRLVFSHCQIVGEVARAMIKRMPDWLGDALFPGRAENGVRSVRHSCKTR